MSFPQQDRLLRIFGAPFSGDDVLLTGLSAVNVRVETNKDYDREDVPDVPTFDSVLTGNGYVAEYYGKWHTPYFYTKGYKNHVKPVNGGCGSHGETNLEAFRKYLDERCKRRPPKPGDASTEPDHQPTTAGVCSGSHGQMGARRN